MKVLVVIAAFATLLAPIHGARRQCAGIDPNNDGSGPFVYEDSGFLTSDWTQKSCAAAGGSIDPNKKGNQKCCNFDDNRFGDFERACDNQKPGNNFRIFSPASQSC
ncbi:hypothetical protein PHMEG_00035999 [Phytophthora megakarya]|uniref:Uncharacterized protein n=1 Tax=Phytophthora megakarya TaxID=4795 RepID=A0A225UM43_9STRA|nr:hypothetical protein PHMEG_00035999 [Phytophthora megakarya]